MNKNKILGLSIFTSIGASLCCITPVLTIIVGVGGSLSFLKWLEPIQPYLIGLAIFSISLLWYQFLVNRGSKDDCGCETTKQKRIYTESPVFLSIMTVFVGGMLLLPYYQKFLTTKDNKTIQIANMKDNSKIEIAIEGMTCNGCENHIEDALKPVKGVIKATASYEKGNVEVIFEPNHLDEGKIKHEIEEKTNYKVVEKEIIN